ncbi:uncharacterized protein GLRG_11235 [Colletotrichum graminicola M1.001]|uniref:Uncharacterized protein n=1 Tax=Colletotrichum graminicola (strain M1.001 / M2 / FGSC 10212) TaxID=645133 RepID=E3QZ03_COLGM|nr:uncharacterized protein GLRG_11235 [Colletotrichum graminicola M1.001]EFQ36091.1 hypothetical protein GLRG_11235 [Colletotrichum graminicola M1.001]
MNYFLDVKNTIFREYEYEWETQSASENGLHNPLRTRASFCRVFRGNKRRSPTNGLVLPSV